MASLSTENVFDWKATGDEVVKHLQAILRIDTSNPPGNETPVAEYLRTVLQREGIECVLVGPTPERQSLIARLHGDGSQAPLLLMSHTDVVPVERDQWTYDPFGGQIANGHIYGRGALDMKHMVAMELMVMLLLKRAAVPLKRDVIYLAAADEEAGGYYGANWVATHHPDLIRAEYALNEGGGDCLEILGKRYFTVEAGEKGGAAVRIKVQGTPGHASQPHNDNAIIKLAAILSRLADQTTPVHFTATTRHYIEAIARTQPPEIAQAFRAILADEQHADQAIDHLPVSESFKRELRAIIRNTVTPTMLQAGTRQNVIPSQAEATLDCRILPGWTQEAFRAELRALLGTEVEIEPMVEDRKSPPLEVDFQSPLVDVIRQVLHEHDPEATLIPMLLSGGTDAKHVTDLGIKVYGFAPTLYENPNDVETVHGHNERISVHSMHWGTRVLYEVVTRFATT